MKKTIRIIVTRSVAPNDWVDDEPRTVDLWMGSAESRLKLIDNNDGWKQWWEVSGEYRIASAAEFFPEDFKNLFGFLPRKGTKVVLEITRSNNEK